MSDTFKINYCIGGRITAAAFEYISGCFSGNGCLETEIQAIVDDRVLREVVKSGSPIKVETEDSFSEFDSFLSRLKDFGLSYRAELEGDFQYDGEVRIYIPGTTESPLVFPLGAQGEVMIPMSRISFLVKSQPSLMVSEMLENMQIDLVDQAPDCTVSEIDEPAPLSA